MELLTGSNVLFWLAVKSMKDDNDIGKILLIVFVSYTNFAFKPQIIDNKTCHTLFSVLYLFIFTLSTWRFTCHVSSPSVWKTSNGFDFKVSQRRFELACAFFIFAEKGQDAVDARDLSRYGSFREDVKMNDEPIQLEPS